MTHALDHVFILCAAGAPEAAALARLGLLEGSPNTHPGQGTACRRFFFRNAYLELLWVSDAEEAQSAIASPTRLWERWSGRHTGACPFGIVLRPSGSERADPPFATWPYRPPYLPPEIAIEVAVGTPLTEPELFYWRLPRRPDALRDEPIEHSPPLRELTGLSIGSPGGGPRTPALRAAEATGLLSLQPSAEHVMHLEFDEGVHRSLADLRPDLSLVLRW